jgi:hypothetical protein
MKPDDDKALVTVDGEALVAIDDEALLTRRAAVMLIRETFGIPLPESRFDKDSANGIAPRPDAIYGRTHLYRRGKALAYGRSLIKAYPPNAA